MNDDAPVIGVLLQASCRAANRNFDFNLCPFSKLRDLLIESPPVANVNTPALDGAVRAHVGLDRCHAQKPTSSPSSAPGSRGGGGGGRGAAGACTARIRRHGTVFGPNFVVVGKSTTLCPAHAP